MAKLLLGKEVTDALNADLQTRTAALREKGIVPTLGIIRVGANPSDLSYEKGAMKRAELVGVEVKKYELPEDATKEQVLAVIDEVNADASIHGVLMFRPLPKHLKADQNEICNRLAPQKDVDCMTHMSNAGVLNSLTADFVRPGQIVIDVSINWDANKPNAKGGLGGIAGDAKFDEVEPIVDAITPVPGGVGSVTTSVLMKHVVEAAERA